MAPDYSTVTELPGSKASQEQLARLYHRYHFASLFCKDKDVLEVACGAGIGLGYLAKFAKTVTGGDVDEHVLEYAYETYKDRKNITIKKLDAHKLPYEDNSIDVVILYEAIYYLSQPANFIDETKRVLRDQGTFIVCTVNKDWGDFNPSPFSINYFSGIELHQLLSRKFDKITIYAAFPTSKNSIKNKIFSLIKRIAIRFHLVPKTMKGKEYLKRIFFGKLMPLPAEVMNGMTHYDEPKIISHSQANRRYKVLYAVASDKTGNLRCLEQQENCEGQREEK